MYGQNVVYLKLYIYTHTCAFQHAHVHAHDVHVGAHVYTCTHVLKQLGFKTQPTTDKERVGGGIP